MKKLFLLLITVIFTNITQTITAQCGSSVVGTSNYVNYSSLSDMAIAPDNKIYTFAYNSSAMQFQLHAAYAASSWSLVATLSGSTSVKPDIAVSKTGKVSVFFRDNLDGSRGKVYTLSGSTFTAIGTAISTSSVSNLSLAFNLAGNECIAYTDISNSNKSTVKQWNGTSSWDNVGAGTVSTGGGFFNSLLVDKNDKYVLAFQDANSGNKTNVCRYNAGVWTSLGMIGSTANNCKLKEATNGDYYLGFTETANNAQIHKYNGSVWSQVGATISSISSTANNFDLELDAVDSPYLLAVTTSTPDIVFYRYSFSSWSMVTSFSNTSSNVLALSIDNKGLPFMFHVDVPSNAGLNVKQLVSMVNLTTQPTSTTVCVGQSPTFLVSTMGGSPFFQWQQAQFGEFTDIPGATSSSYSTPPANPGMNQYKYRCVVNSGCSNIISNSGTLTVTSLNINTTSTNPTCSGSNDGVITSTVVGGTFPYSYNWTPVGGTTSTASFLTAGSYTLNVVDANTCATSTVVSLTNPPAISSSFSGNFYICNGSSTTLTVTSTGGTGPYTYSWTPSASLSSSTGSVVTANPSSMQTYNVQATDVLGCIATTTVMVDFYANQPTITANSSSGTICNGSNVTLTSSGINVDTYVWYPGGLTGSTQNVMPSTTTTYTVVGTNTLTGCQASATVAITVNPNPTANAGPTRTLTCVNTSTTLAGSGVGGTNYNWTGPGIVSGATTLNPTINAPGIYNLSVISVFGCSSAPSPVSVSQNITPPSPTASTTGTLTCSTLTVALNGTPGTGVTYQWTGPGFSGGTTSQNAVANAAGSFTLRATSSINGCTNTAVTNVTQNVTAPNPFASSSGTLNCGVTTVTLTALPASGVTYSWSGPGTIFNPTSQTTAVNTGGTFTLSITSLTNGCSNTFPLVVSQNTVVPVVTPAMSGSLTCVTNTITAYVTTTTTPVTYNWTGTGILTGATTASITTNVAGIKNYVVTNSINLCSATGNVTVALNTVTPTVNGSSSAINCYNATANVGVSTVASPVSYNWTGPGITSATNISTITVNQGGNYSYSVTNTANGCVNANSISVAQNTTAPTTNTNVSGTLNCTLTSVNASVSTTVTPVTYIWSGAGITSATNISTITVNAPGVKNYTVTNTSNGCMTTGSLNVAQNLLAATPTATATGTITCLSNTVQLSGNPASGVTYTWSAPGGSSISSGVNTQNAIGNGPGTYTLFITMISSGCANSKTVTAMQNTTTPSANAGMDQTLTCSTTTVTLFGSAIPSSCTPVWSGPVSSGSNTFNATTSIAGNYSLTVTNPANGCSATDEVQVIINSSIPTITTSVSNSITCTNLTATLNAITTASSPTYLWSGTGIVAGSTTPNAVVNQPGVYTVSITDAISGCVNTSTVTVVSDITVPSVILSSSTATITCFNPTVTISSSVSPITTMYSWVPIGGLVAGTETTGNPTFNAAGSYTATVTNTVNGCVTTETVTVFLNTTLPTINIVATPSVICSGNSSTLTANGAVTYSWSTAQTTTSISVSPSSTDTYTVYGTGANGCTNYTVETITVNSTPALNITGGINICKGSSTTLTGSGATTYTWDSGANTTTISVTPTITTTYTLTGDNGNGCIASLPVTVSIVSSKDITGVITNTGSATGGDVILYKYSPLLSQWDSVTVVPLTSSYSFSNIDSALYVVRAIPTATNIQVTYGYNSISWQNASVITHGCTNNTNQDIDLISLANFTMGPGVLTGTVVEASGFGNRMSSEFKPMVPGEPIGGIVVKGGRNPGGQMFVQTITATDGTYTLTGLPLNTGSDSYFIMVDIPGLDTNGTYHVVITGTDTVINNLNFTVDSIYINPIGSVTGIANDKSVLENKILLFPNPANQNVSIQYELVQSANIKIDLFDIVGNKVKTIAENSIQEKNKYTHSINIENLSNGVYFVRLTINNSNTTIKLIINK